MKTVKYISLLILIFIALGFGTAQGARKSCTRGVHDLSTKLPQLSWPPWLLYRGTRHSKQPSVD